MSELPNKPNAIMNRCTTMTMLSSGRSILSFIVSVVVDVVVVIVSDDDDIDDIWLNSLLWFDEDGIRPNNILIDMIETVYLCIPIF